MKVLSFIYKSRFQRVIRFGLVGISGIPVNYLFIYVGKAWAFKGLSEGLADALSYLLGIVVSILSNFVLNYLWTWGDRRESGIKGFFRQMGKFYVVSVVAAVVQYTVSMGTSLWLSHYESMRVTIASNYRLYNAIAPAVGIGVAFVINFWVNNKWTFKALQADKTDGSSEKYES